MAEPASVRLDPETQRQMTSLRELWGTDVSNTIRRALRETYAAECRRLAAVRVGPDVLAPAVRPEQVARDHLGRVAELRPADL